MKRILIIIILILSKIILLAQDNGKEIQFINANRFMTTEELGPDIKIFVGEVALEHDSTIMFCDSATYNIKLKQVNAFGNIEIQRLHDYDTIFLYGDTLHYDGNTRIAQVRDNVILQDDTTVLTTNFLDFDMNQNYGKYFNGGRVINGTDTIISQNGYYFSKSKEVFFKGNVQVFSKKAKIFTDTLKHNLDTRISYILGPSEIYSDSNYIFAEFGRYDYDENRAYLSHKSLVKSGEHTISADSLYYDRTNGKGQGFGNVTIIDTVQNLILKGNYGEFYEKNQFSMMTDSALFIEIDEQDTLWLHSDTLLSYIDTLKDEVDTIPFRMVFAFNHVKLFKNDLQVKCDSLVYSQLDSVLMLFGSPIIWSEKDQLYANYIELYMSRNNPREMFMYDSCFVAEEVDTTGYNIVKSDFLHAWFHHRQVDKVQVTGNVDAVYYLQDDADSAVIGVGVLNCDSMNIFINNSQIQMLVPYIDPQGNIYPPDDVPPDKKSLPGFEWKSDARPLSKDDIFIWKEDE